MTACTKCKRRDAMENDALCRGCFFRSVEEKVQKGVRLANVFSKGGRIDKNESAAMHVLQRVLEKSVRRPQGTAIISSLTLEEINARFFEDILANRNSSGKKDETVIFPMQDVTQKECEKYCALKGIAFTKQSGSEMTQFIAGFEERRPGVHHSIARSRKHVNEKNHASADAGARDAEHERTGNN